MEPIIQDFKSHQKILSVLGFHIAPTGGNLAKLKKSMWQAIMKVCSERDICMVLVMRIHAPKLLSSASMVGEKMGHGINAAFLAFY